MIPLPTLGGYNGVATQVNNLGEVAGYAENSIPDPHCPPPQVLHFKPVVWKNGRIHKLPTFRGDPDRSGHKYERQRTDCRRIRHLCNFQPD